MAQHYIKQLIFSWLRMVHRKVILLQYALELNLHSGNTPCKGKSFKIPMLLLLTGLFIFTPQTPPSHQSKGNPWRQTRCGHELSPRDIPPSAVP